MGIFNQHSDNQQQRFLRGIQGSPGIGFSLTKDGNYNTNHKKLKNVGEGVESPDAITKQQLEVSMNNKLDKTSLNNFVKKNSPEVGADLDMKGFAIKNLKVTPGGDGSQPRSQGFSLLNWVGGKRPWHRLVTCPSYTPKSWV